MTDKKLFEEYTKLFLEENHKVNLISKNEEKFLWEKHIYDSLALEKVFEKYGIPESLLDIGTGGGFPALPVAISNPQINVYAVDSIAKKIRAIQTIKDKLGVKNLFPICSRVENITGKYQMITSRAVASLDKICDYALPKLEANGYFAAFKSQKALEEIDNAKNILKKYNAKVLDIIDYKLPIEDSPQRNIIVINIES